MKISKETSAKHREELLNAASRLFRERGYRQGGIAEIAAAAGLTHGAFYTHFESTEALREVIGLGSGRSRAALALSLNWRASVEAYLSPKQVRDRATGCSFAALGGDVPRESETIRTAFSEALERPQGSGTQARARAAKRSSRGLPPSGGRWCWRASPRLHDCGTRSWARPATGCSTCRESEPAISLCGADSGHRVALVGQSECAGCHVGPDALS